MDQPLPKPVVEGLKFSLRYELRKCRYPTRERIWAARAVV